MGPKEAMGNPMESTICRKPTVIYGQDMLVSHKSDAFLHNLGGTVN